MGQVLHGSARTTAATRRAIPHGQERLQSLAARRSVNPKTVAKWRKYPHGISRLPLSEGGSGP